MEKNLYTSGADISEMRPVGRSFANSGQVEQGIGASVGDMTEKADVDGEQFVNTVAILHEKEREEEKEKEKESELGMVEISLDGEDDEGTPSDTKL